MAEAPFPSARIHEAHERVAARLRELRLDAGLTGREVAARTGWQTSKVSRLQTGTTLPADDDITAWCKACGAEGQAPDIIAAARNAGSMYMEWRRLQRTGLKRVQESRTPVHERTKAQRVYSSSVIPGMLQTREYAAALLSNIARFHGTPDDSADAADARVARSQIIRRPGHTFSVVVEESVLRRRVGGAETMAAQLGHLLTLATLPAVSLGIIPASTPAIWPLETFTIYDDTTVYVELLTAALTISAPSEIAQYLAAFGEMADAAVFGQDAYRIIAGAISALG
ncbi:helix-turn-helix domain-containing protein [Streptomyces sp. NBC_01217]|uniref:helix-turn-helix domain-containing protein n=1 Tax=Streptomyces sp. NBC_01217 TaxID=2903779 RepID=UPI002E148F6A|nr:helix-turn-helix transcriptional regulator [Streptomyces sp. NBC_01217]